MRLLAAAVAAVSCFVPAHAATLIDVVGEVWESSTTLNNVADARAAISGNAAAMWDVTAIDYPNTDNTNTLSSNTSLSTFLGVDGASIVGTDISELVNTVFRFTGKIRVDQTGETWSVGSDDGFELLVDNQIEGAFTNVRGFGTTSGTLDMAPGIYTFELVYFERNGNTGVEFKLNDELALNTSSVPVPGAAVLMGGVLAAGAARRKARR